MLTACGANPATVQLTVANNDPLAPPELRQLSLSAPPEWTLTADGGGATDGQFVVTVTTLSRAPADPQTTLQSINGKAYDTVVVERQGGRLTAWFLLDGTLTTAQMQSRTPVSFAQAHDDILVSIARSVEIAP